MAGEGSPKPDWRDARGYAPLLHASPENLAWEWLRRDPGYAAAAVAAAAASGPRHRGGAGSGVIEADPAAARWGLHAFENPAFAAGAARPVWRREWFGRVLVAEARAEGPAGERLDLARFAGLVRVVRGAGGAEHVLLSDGRSGLRLDIAAGSLLAGPVLLSYRLAGIEAPRGSLVTLHGLLRLVRTGRFARAPVRTRNRRLVLLLRAHDALRAGATQREIADGLLGGDAALAHWRTEAPSLRSQAQRLAKGARAMAGGGWRALLAG